MLLCQSRASDELAASPAAFGKLISLNALDLQLYDDAKAIFHEQMLDLLQAAAVEEEKQRGMTTPENPKRDGQGLRGGAADSGGQTTGVLGEVGARETIEVRGGARSSKLPPLLDVVSGP